MRVQCFYTLGSFLRLQRRHAPCPFHAWPCTQCHHALPSHHVIRCAHRPPALQPGNHYLLNNTIPILNICFASVLLPALLACWAIFGWRVVR